MQHRNSRNEATCNPDGARAMTLVGGVVAYAGPAPHLANVDAAASSAPWRGRPHSPVVVPNVGLICAQGSAIAGIRDGIAIGMYGRIDNLSDIASSLRKDPDDRLGLIARLYQERHDEFAAGILGDFSIVVVDPHRRSLLATRDWIGMRPLFWLRQGEHVAVATEIKQALALLDAALRPAEAPLKAFVAHEALDPTTTFVAGVHAVPACGQLLATLGKCPRSWRRDLEFRPIQLDFEEAVAEIRRVLEMAVARRMPAEASAGAMLSGGVDSTAVTAIAAHLARAGAVPRLQRCYTISLPEIPACDESGPASMVAVSCDLDWQPVVIEIEDYRAWPAGASKLHDGPVYPTACGASLIVAAASADGIDVLLNGVGGDEFADQTGDEFRLCLLRREWTAALKWLRAGGARQRANHCTGSSIATMPRFGERRSQPPTPD